MQVLKNNFRVFCVQEIVSAYDEIEKISYSYLSINCPVSMNRSVKNGTYEQFETSVVLLTANFVVGRAKINTKFE